MLKLNLGAGNVEIEGFTPVDRRLGSEVYPLDYDDDSVEEIRASHILEHFGHKEILPVLKEWVRVLKPGGRIRLAVPDFDHIVKREDPNWFNYLMGGQTDENDFHKSVFTKDMLSAVMEAAGIEGIQPWTSTNTDCASLPCSLNLEGFKPGAEVLKLKACMTVPRYGSMAARGIIDHGLRTLQIPLDTSQGVYWGAQMQRHLEEFVDQEVDWILTIDYDSLFSPEQLDRLLGVLGGNPQIDALAALQVRRESENPLLSQGTAENIKVDGLPILVTTAHFGLTLLRVDSLKKVAKPWFCPELDEHKSYGPNRLDPDIFFWHQWRKAGNTIYVDPQCRIGHLEECASYYVDGYEVERCTIPQWRDRFLNQKAVKVD